MQNTIIGTYAGIGSLLGTPIRLAPQPHWKMATITPTAAPIDSRFRIAAFVAMTTDRKAVVSRMNAIAITARISQASLLVIRLVKSTAPAVVPVTYVVACCLGSTSSRRVATRFVVAVACGRVVGITLSTAVVPVLFNDGGATDATPCVAARLDCMPLSSEFVACLDW